MPKNGIRAEFEAASKERQLRFSANIIEEMAEKGRSDRKISEYLDKIGASDELIREAFDLARDEGLVSETDRAKEEVGKIILEEGGISVKTARKILSKLSYSGFNEETLAEISEILEEMLGIC